MAEKLLQMARLQNLLDNIKPKSNKPIFYIRKAISNRHIECTEIYGMLVAHMINKDKRIEANKENLSYEYIKSIYPQSSRANRILQILDDKEDFLCDLIEGEDTPTRNYLLIKLADEINNNKFKEEFLYYLKYQSKYYDVTYISESQVRYLVSNAKFDQAKKEVDEEFDRNNAFMAWPIRIIFSFFYYYLVDCLVGYTTPSKEYFTSKDTKKNNTIAQDETIQQHFQKALQTKQTNHPEVYKEF